MAAKIDGCDNLQVMEFSVVIDGDTARIVVAGADHPPVLLDFSKEKIFQFAGKALRACDEMDHEQLVGSLRVAVDRMGILPAASSPSVADGAQGGAWVAQSVSALQDQAAQAVASMARLGETLLLIATRSAAVVDSESAGLPGPPWHVDIAVGSLDVDVDSEKGVVFLVVDESKVQDAGLIAMSQADATLLGSVLQAAGAHVRRFAASASASASASAPSAPDPEKKG